MNIVKRELKSNLKSMIIWCISIAFLVTIWMMEFEYFSGNPEVDAFMESMPQDILKAMGIADMKMSSLDSFISAISHYIYLVLGIHGVLLGSSTLSKEERDKTAEYLFSLPVTRQRVILGKTISSIINLLLLNIVTIGSILISSMSYEKAEGFYEFIGLLFLGIFIFQLLFLSIGMLVSSINRSYKKSGNISVTILMITFLMSSLINMVDSLEFLKYITPFKYFEGSYILREKTLAPVYIIISILIIAIGIGGTFVFYPKRDLYI